MSLFGSMMGDVEDDPFFGSHMRHMRQMNNMMNSLFSDPFGMLGVGGGGLGMAPRHPMNAMMPLMPQMPNINRLFGDMQQMGNLANMGASSSFSSSTVVMSSGPNGKPQVFSSSSSTKIGPNGVKETRKTLQDSRTGTKKMSIGHHIGERAHVVERAQNVYSGDAEENQEFINIEEDEAEQFDREFQEKAGALPRSTLAIQHPSYMQHSHTSHAHGAPPERLALPAPSPNGNSRSGSERRHSHHRPSARRPLRANASPVTTSSSVRSVYGGAHPQRRHKHKHSHRSSPADQ